VNAVRQNPRHIVDVRDPKYHPFCGGKPHDGPFKRPLPFYRSGPRFCRTASVSESCCKGIPMDQGPQAPQAQGPFMVTPLRSGYRAAPIGEATGIEERRPPGGRSIEPTVPNPPLVRYLRGGERLFTVVLSRELGTLLGSRSSDASATDASLARQRIDAESCRWTAVLVAIRFGGRYPKRIRQDRNELESPRFDNRIDVVSVCRRRTSTS
jgi:hypothetical protein